MTTEHEHRALEAWEAASRALELASRDLAPAEAEKQCASAALAQTSDNDADVYKVRSEDREAERLLRRARANFTNALAAEQSARRRYERAGDLTTCVESIAEELAEHPQLGPAWSALSQAECDALLDSLHAILLQLEQGPPKGGRREPTP